MSYSSSLEKAISSIKKQTYLIQRSLNKRDLMSALKYASLMLAELRNPKLPPKQYYEIYTLIFDSLSNLSLYLIDNHPNHHHLADLYELVQYAGNVLPRLYLMITVGASYLQCPNPPRDEILKDMMEMCRAIQNPIRGLFIRYYLSQTTKQILIQKLKDDSDNDSNLEVSMNFNCQYIITNFIEMNKLWVRLQHQGPLRERKQRTKERKELQILVGSQLVALSEIIDDNFTIYKEKVLPVILEQITQCRDVIAQEYLFEILFQVFPDEFHLETLPLLLDAMLHLNPELSHDKLLWSLVERLNVFIVRQNEGLNAVDGMKEDNLFKIFWQFVSKLNEERPDLSLQQTIGLVKSLLNLSLKWYPESVENLDHSYELVLQKYQDLGDDPVPIDSECFLSDLILLKNIDIHEKDRTNTFLKLVSQSDSYRKLLSLQRLPLQQDIINELLDAFTMGFFGTNSEANASKEIINSKVQLEHILSMCEPIIKSRISLLTPKEGNNNITEDEAQDDDEQDETFIILDANQEKLAKFTHVIINSLNNSEILYTVEKQMECLLILKSWYYKGGSNIKYTYPSIITNFWKLIRKSNKLKSRLPKKKSYYDDVIKKLFKHISRCTNDLFNLCGNSYTDAIYKFNLQSASLADQLSLNEISYDFFSQAFTVFEESLSDSKTQFQSLVYMAQTLQKTRSLYKESYYDSLIVRCTLHGSKLLKKQDQCRAVYLCSHLWWATEISILGEEEGVTRNFHRDGKRVLECIQRSLRSADSIMDNVQSCELMIEIFNRCLYYFIHGDESENFLTIKYINGLIELIKTNLKNLRLEGDDEDLMIDTAVQQLSRTNISNSQFVQDIDDTLNPIFMGEDGSYIELSKLKGTPANVSSKISSAKMSNLIRIPIRHYNGTREYVMNQSEIDDRFKVINI
ncbi:vacuolar protein sorting-associated protein 35 NDAI_0A01010 [Naumovozyma dairenensis CBS 421]|uniref:Vacuolar protein sorting-associated protein 35 n=1 Tax=Naumovozyma dairenensis (strain ATCC 10597 / BCRC 20456 / CBS 421 / NBRC 0211 / NRRL Y-12639) TaxID=1071378 RepID=G0W371_NAUDC|nr:hypothetical protein NDAI_0A01010 [Naumovozyma dairenensis CBS 421]CCD22259.1 hypothetical protein NDAI_0A01010 [Naumovozyma dairenensis CBS 421]